jgi:hypothetical protein
MTYKAGGNPLSPWCKGRFLFLLISLLGLIVLAPLLEDFAGIRILLDVFVTAVFISDIYAVSRKRITSTIAIALALPMFASTWASYFLESPSLVLAGNFFGIAFLAFALIATLSHILREREVTDLGLVSKAGASPEKVVLIGPNQTPPDGALANGWRIERVCKPTFLSWPFAY